MAVAFDAKMTGGDLDSGRCYGPVGTTSFSTTGMTVGVGATCLVVTIVFGNGSGVLPASIAATWDGVAMTLQANVTSSDAPANNRAAAAILVLVNPASGNKTLAGSWTGTLDAYVSCVSFTGTDTTTGVNATNNTTATQATAIVVPTTSDGATVACFGVDGSDPTVDQTEMFSTAPNDPGGGASYALGGATSNTHNFTGAGGDRQALAGVNVIAAGGGGATPKNVFGKMLSGPFGGAV